MQLTWTQEAAFKLQTFTVGPFRRAPALPQ